MIVCAAIVATAQTQKPANGEIPYHPYRKVGEKYFNVQPIYEWLKSDPKFRSHQFPMDGWIVVRGNGSDGTLHSENLTYDFRVLGIARDGLIIDAENASRDGRERKVMLFLTNYPGFEKLTDGAVITFIAKESGNHRYVTANNSVATVPCYDYGTPYNPWAMSGTNSVKTNAVPANPPAAR